jgi:lysophospholipase L1-like esterase
MEMQRTLRPVPRALTMFRGRAGGVEHTDSFAHVRPACLLTDAPLGEGLYVKTILGRGRRQHLSTRSWLTGPTLGLRLGSARLFKEFDMRGRLIGCGLLLALAIATRAAAADPPYYLALGDSLAIGIQPDAAGKYEPTNQGYVDDLYAFFHAYAPSLQLTKLGCSGETTTSMISGQGSPCSYPAGSQLAEALLFLQTHRVQLITIDIGADDLLQCFDLQGAQFDGCISAAFLTTPNHLAGILSALHAAAPNALIVGMNYYDPFLAAWIFGPTGQALAASSLTIMTKFNSALASIYRALQVPMADVAGTFRINSTFPRVTASNITLALAWTWMSAQPPRGPDVHPNAVGYLAIASAFARVIAVTP